MRQVALLDCYKGRWYFATSNERDPIRQWMDKEAALSELAGEGWMLSVSYLTQQKPGRPKEQRFYGFVLTRMVQ